MMKKRTNYNYQSSLAWTRREKKDGEVYLILDPASSIHSLRHQHPPDGGRYDLYLRYTTLVWLGVGGDSIIRWIDPSMYG